jgi:hypothetical protein
MTITLDSITTGSPYIDIYYTTTGASSPSINRPIFLMTKGLNSGDVWQYHQPKQFDSPIPFPTPNDDLNFKLLWYYDANNQVESNEFIFRSGGVKSDPVLFKKIEEIRSRSPFRHIVPTRQPDSINVSVNVTTSGFISYQSALTGTYEWISVTSGDYDLENVVRDTVVAPDGSTITNNGGGTNNFNWTSATFEIKSWDGFFVSDEPSDILYFKDKSKLIKTQNLVFVNLSNITSERLEGDIKNYLYPNDLDNSQAIGIKESKWARVYTKFYYLNNLLDIKQDNYFFVLDGFTETNPLLSDTQLERQVLPNILLTNKKLEYIRDSFAKIHFKVKDLLFIKAIPENNKNTNPPYFINFFDNITTLYNEPNGLSYFYIQSIRIDTSKSVRYEFVYNTGTEVVLSNPFDGDCKYEPYQIVFKNKWGVLESLSAGKKSDLETSIESKDYLRSLVDFTGYYDGTRHSNKQFNLNAFDNITLNTDFLPEYMNDTVKEMLLSNEIWIIKQIGSETSITPVLRQDSSIKYKTTVNDKLIQYTFKFKFSHNKINNII